MQDSMGKRQTTGMCFAPLMRPYENGSFQTKLSLFLEVLHLVEKSNYMNHTDETHTSKHLAGAQASDECTGMPQPEGLLDGMAWTRKKPAKNSSPQISKPTC